MKLLTIILFLSAFNLSSNTDSTKKLRKFLFLPIVFKSPETGLSGGISAGYNFKTTNKEDTLTRSSIIQGVTLFTKRGQNVQALDVAIYFPLEKNILYLQSSHAYYPDKFWGLGPKTADKWQERYIFEQFYFFPHYKYQFKKHFFIGVLYEFQKVFNISYKKYGIFDTTFFPGKSEYKTSGAGGSFSHDTRNKAYWPTKGLFSQVTFTGFNTVFFSDFNYGKMIIDIRYFKTVFKNQVFAFQFYSFSTFGRPPLRDLAALGGQTNLRGIYNGRYRDNNFYSFIGEYRVPVYKRFACVFFAGFGSVYNSINQITAEDVKGSYGGGLRYALLKKERLNLRLDYGYSNRHNKGFYFTVAECF